jgi:hypothetical protein
MGGAFYLWEKIEVRKEFRWKDLKEKGHLEDMRRWEDNIKMAV